MIAKVIIVIDSGTRTVKFGFSHDNEPVEVFTVVGYPRLSCSYIMPNDDDSDEIIVGEAALIERRRVRLEHPIAKGQIKESLGSMRGIELIYRHIYSELQVNPEDFSVLVTEPILADKSHTKTLQNVFFDRLGVPEMAIISQPVASLLAFGRSTGFVVDIGEDLTQIAPIYEGELISHAAVLFPLSGSDLTNFFKKLLNDKSHMFHDEIDIDNVRKIKEKLCYVAISYEHEDVTAVNYELSDGKHIFVEDERVQCPEALFQPTLVGLNNSKGLHEAIHESIMKCDETLREELFKNIVLSGGSSQLPNLSARLEVELKSLTKFEVKVENHDNSKFTSWLGSSILAQSQSFGRRLVSND